MHGWFSAQQACIGGTSRYSTPDGKEIIVSQVTPTEETFSQWNDLIYLGPVTAWIRKETEGSLRKPELKPWRPML